MPPAIQYIMDRQSLESRALEQAFATEYDERARRFEKNWQYYDGIMPKPLKTELDGVDDNVILAKVDQLADKIVSFLLGDGVRFDSGGDGKATETDDLVAALWAANRSQMLLHNIALSGALTGHNAVRLEPREGQMPRIVHINAAHFSAFWDMADIDRVLWYRLQYRMNSLGPGKRIDYVRGQFDGENVNHDAEGWIEMVYEIKGAMPDWARVSVTPWPYAWAPVVDWQNMPRPHSYYGADDIRRAVALNDAVNFVASNYNRILKHHGAPKTIGIGFEAEAVVGTEVGGFYTVNKPKSEAEIYNLEMTSDLGSAREFLALLTREVWQSGRMVDPQLIKDTVGSLTNFGLRVMFADALTKTATKRLLYGEAFEQISKRGIELAGKAAPDRVLTVWPDVLPEDNAEVGTVLLKELEAGAIDKQTYREVRGYNHEAIEERLAEEKTGEENIGSLMLQKFAKGG